LAEPKIKEFTDLVAWRKSHALVLAIYTATRTFPSDERFGMISQMRRAAYSVAANIAEGFTRQGIRGKQQCYNVSQGSLQELRYFLILAKDLGYLKEMAKLDQHCQEVARLLNGLISAAETRPPAKS
jgi:four helix bundle protein